MKEESRDKSISLQDFFPR